MELIIPDLDRRGLRNFGLTTAAIVGGLFGLLIPFLISRSLPLWPWVIAGGLTFMALLLPAYLNPVYRGWMRVGFVLGWINTHIILGLVYYTLFLPIALVKKVAGKDAMCRQLVESSDSYRQQSERKSAQHMKRPY